MWNTDDVVRWEESLQGYDAAVASASKQHLVELDRWFQNELPTAIQRRKQPHLTQEELIKLVDWKLTRGKWRPRLLGYAKQAQPQLVLDTTAAALTLLNPAGGDARPSSSSSIKAALKKLVELKGVGPATASAVLAAADPSCPFMSDEALEAAVSTRKYTVEEYLQLVERLRAKAQRLSTAGHAWTASEVERALWAAAHGAVKQTKSKRPSTSVQWDGDKTTDEKPPAGEQSRGSTAGNRRSKRLKS